MPPTDAKIQLDLEAFKAAREYITSPPMPKLALELNDAIQANSEAMEMRAVTTETCIRMLRDMVKRGKSVPEAMNMVSSQAFALGFVAALIYTRAGGKVEPLP